jgi:hypothetical protein
VRKVKGDVMRAASCSNAIDVTDSTLIAHAT